MELPVSAHLIALVDMVRVRGKEENGMPLWCRFTGQNEVRPMLVAGAFANLSLLSSSPDCVLGLDNPRLLAACRRVCSRPSQCEGEAVHTWFGRTDVGDMRRTHPTEAVADTSQPA